MSRVLSHKVVKIEKKIRSHMSFIPNTGQHASSSPTTVPENVFISPPWDEKNSVMG